MCSPIFPLLAATTVSSKWLHKYMQCFQTYSVGDITDVVKIYGLHPGQSADCGVSEDTQKGQSNEGVAHNSTTDDDRNGRERIYPLIKYISARTGGRTDGTGGATGLFPCRAQTLGGRRQNSRAGASFIH